MAEGLRDIIAERLDVLFCGINPGMQAAATGHHFAGRSNRFWRTVHLAGFTPIEIVPRDGATFLQYGCGLTTFVERPTARADQLQQQEFGAAAAAFERKIARYAPRFLAFLGKAAYAHLSGSKHVGWGLQPIPMAASTVWVLPNPSGRNRAFSLEQLVEAYSGLHQAVIAAPGRS